MQGKSSPQEGQMAPDFTAQNHLQEQVQLSRFRGHSNVVLVFYPGDSTPLCTSQLCAFRDSWGAFQAEDTEVFGVNPSSEKRHAQFVEQQNFPFSLLVDRGNTISSAYGRLMLMGLMIRRGVFLIDKRGIIVKIWEGNPPPSAVLEAINALPKEV